MAHDHPTRNPPNLYSLPFVASTMGAERTLFNQPIRNGYCNAWGEVWMGDRKFYVISADDAAQYMRRAWAGNGFTISGFALEIILQARIHREKVNLGRLQKHLQKTPYEKLEWASNYAHHPPPTKRK